MKKIKEFLLRTSSQFAISSILIMGLTVPTAAFAGEDRINDTRYDQEKPSTH